MNNEMGLHITEFRIDRVMQEMPVESQYRWCEAKLCCCLGCANKAGRLVELGFSRGDWLWWVARHPEPKKDKYGNYVVG